MQRIALRSLAACLILAASCRPAPTLYHGWWQGNLVRPDGQNIVFNFLVKDSAGKTILYVRNAAEMLLVDSVQVSGDSVQIHMPFFEASFRARLRDDGALEGVFVRHLANSNRLQPFVAYPNHEERFALSDGPATVHVSGRYAARFIGRNGNTEDTAVGEFHQQGNAVTGTFLTPSGDYRYLEGVVTGDSLKVSTFDGSHAYVFTAKVTQPAGDSANAGTAISGSVFSGIAPSTRWEGTWNPDASWPEGDAEARLLPDSSTLNFRFPDLDSNMVSIRDPRFQGKVVIIQIMGSWCPNCMDETSFLGPYYKQNKDRGVEIVALAYERSTDFQRSRTSLLSFKRRFGVEYPMLITGVTVGDPDKTRKTLPQLDAIKAFPTTIVLDKHGRVRHIHAGFEGPGTGEHYAQFQKDFSEEINELLAEH